MFISTIDTINKMKINMKFSFIQKIFIFLIIFKRKFTQNLRQFRGFH